MHPLAVGRRVEVVADLGLVLVTCDGVEAARHARSSARHPTDTEPETMRPLPRPPVRRPPAGSRHRKSVGGA
ncbi:Mu transposase domain-containing protein [Streptomyces sp. RO-S4]|uniref:Mu transposase domain-containing protein n=1 Tax=unclassified Streptomyces TaxID=2593676 RepID=UPI0035B1BE11